MKVFSAFLKQFHDPKTSKLGNSSNNLKQKPSQSSPSNIPISRNDLTTQPKKNSLALDSQLYFHSNASENEVKTVTFMTQCFYNLSTEESLNCKQTARDQILPSHDDEISDENKTEISHRKSH